MNDNFRHVDPLGTDMGSAKLFETLEQVDENPPQGSKKRHSQADSKSQSPRLPAGVFYFLAESIAKIHVPAALGLKPTQGLFKPNSHAPGQSATVGGWGGFEGPAMSNPVILG